MYAAGTAVTQGVPEAPARPRERRASAFGLEGPTGKGGLSGRTAMAFQDGLYNRYCRRHGALPEGSEEYRRELLQRLRRGDVAWLTEELRTAAPGSWDFLFPPGEGQEGWCRSPLSILVLPKEPFLAQQFLPGVTEQVRLRLVQEALERGVASAHIEGSYWSCPAIHAALSGNVEMLEALHNAGMDLTALRVKWDSNVTAQFGIAHAAAINGHVKALKWMAEVLQPVGGQQWMDRPDSAGNTPLFYAVQTARSVEAAAFLLTQGCDAFQVNQASGKSPLSAAVELLPEAARAFLESKTCLGDAWWGNPVQAHDFEGIAVDAAREGQLRFKSEAGDWLSIEGLITRSGHSELAATAVMERLAEKKWEAFGRDHYNHIFAFFSMVSASYMWEALVGFECGSCLQLASLACTYLGWFGYAWTQILELESRGKQYLSYGWNVLDTLILALVPFGTVPHLLEATGLHLDALPSLSADGSVLDAFALLLMCVRLCRFVAVVSEPKLALYLRTILDVLALSWKPLAFLGSVVGTFAGAFTLLFHTVPEKHVGYMDTVCHLVRWLFEPDDALDVLKELPVQLPAFALFVLFFSAAVLGSLRLVQDSVNLSSLSSEEEARRQFLALRTEVVDDFEQQLSAGSSCPGEQEKVQEFYRELREGGKVLHLEMRTEPWLAGM